MAISDQTRPVQLSLDDLRFTKLVFEVFEHKTSLELVLYPLESTLKGTNVG